MKTGRIHSIETLGALDGPGLRFVVFFAGCPIRCRYCHNPDTWEMSAGKEVTADEIVEKAKRYKPYFKNGGGITLSGGEPMLQPEFALEIMEKCRDAGISACIDTSGSVLNDRVKAALRCAELVLLDVKHTDPRIYHELTGGNLEDNRAFLDYCRAENIPLWIRQVIVPGWNSEPEDIDSLLDYIKGANVQKIELLPYHTLGKHKWETLGIPYRLEGVEPPSPELMDRLRRRLAERQVLRSEQEPN